MSLVNFLYIYCGPQHPATLPHPAPKVFNSGWPKKPGKQKLTLKLVKMMENAQVSDQLTAAVPKPNQ